MIRHSNYSLMILMASMEQLSSAAVRLAPKNQVIVLVLKTTTNLDLVSSTHNTFIRSTLNVTHIFN